MYSFIFKYCTVFKYIYIYTVYVYTYIYIHIYTYIYIYIHIYTYIYTYIYIYIHIYIYIYIHIYSETDIYIYIYMHIYTYYAYIYRARCTTCTYPLKYVDCIYTCICIHIQTHSFRPWSEESAHRAVQRQVHTHSASCFVCSCNLQLRLLSKHSCIDASLKNYKRAGCS